MKRMLMAAVLAALLPVGMAQAQVLGKPTSVPPPSPIPVPIPVPPPQARAPVDYLAPYVRASQQVQIDGRIVLLDFIVYDGMGALRATGLDGAPRGTLSLRLSSILIGALADKRLQHLWPAMIEWAGPDLRKGAAAMQASAHRVMLAGYYVGPSNSVEANAERAGAYLQYSDALVEAGNYTKAVALLRGEVASPRWQPWERNMMRLRLPTLFYENADKNDAIAEYVKAEAAEDGSEYRVNYMVNRAARLAEMGRYAESLAAIDAASAEMGDKKRKYKDSGDRIPGTSRQFDWIRACALNGLGKVKEAEALAARVRNAREPRGDWGLPHTNLQIAVRLAACMKDKEGMVAKLVEWLQGDNIADPLWLRLQPGYAERNAMWAVALKDPGVLKAAGERWRVLPDAMTPALNRFAGAPVAEEADKPRAE